MFFSKKKEIKPIEERYIFEGLTDVEIDKYAPLLYNVNSLIFKVGGFKVLVDTYSDRLLRIYVINEPNSLPDVSEVDSLDSNDRKEFEKLSSEGLIYEIYNTVGIIYEIAATSKLFNPTLHYIQIEDGFKELIFDIIDNVKIYDGRVKDNLLKIKIDKLNVVSKNQNKMKGELSLKINNLLKLAGERSE